MLRWFGSELSGVKGRRDFFDGVALDADWEWHLPSLPFEEKRTI
jgi:hypothetical protein